MSFLSSFIYFCAPYQPLFRFVRDTSIYILRKKRRFFSSVIRNNNCPGNEYLRVQSQQHMHKLHRVFGATKYAIMIAFGWSPSLSLSCVTTYAIYNVMCLHTRIKRKTKYCGKKYSESKTISFMWCPQFILSSATSTPNWNIKLIWKCVNTHTLTYAVRW